MEMEDAQQTGGNVCGADGPFERFPLCSGNNSSSNQRRTTTRRVEDQDRDNMDNSSDSEVIKKFALKDMAQSRAWLGVQGRAADTQHIQHVTEVSQV